MSKRFRVRWLDLAAMLGASILLAAFILYILATAS